MERGHTCRRQQFLKRLGPQTLNCKSIRETHTPNLSKTFIHTIRLFLQSEEMSARIHRRHTDKKSSAMASKIHLQRWSAWLYPPSRNHRLHCRRDGFHYFQSRPIPRTRGQLKYSAKVVSSPKSESRAQAPRTETILSLHPVTDHKSTDRVQKWLSPHFPAEAS